MNRHMYEIYQVEIETNKNNSLLNDKAVVLYVEKGEIEVVVDRRMFELHDQTILLIQPEQEMNVRVVKGRYSLVQFTNYHLVKTGKQLVFEADPLRYKHEFVYCRCIGNAVSKALKHLEKEMTLFRFQALLKEIYDIYEQEERCVTVPIFYDVIRYVKRNAHLPLTREQVAKRFGYNANYFSDSFKKETGCGFNEYLTHIRLENAKNLLLQSSDTVQQVATKVGYQDGLYFSRRFSKHVGISPSEFRNRQRIERVATLQFTGALLATGLTPCAVLDVAYNVPDVIRNHTREARLLSYNWLKENIDWGDEKPDLIFASEHAYPNLSYMKHLQEVAPVISLPWGGQDRLEEVRMIAHMIGREEQAERWIDGYKDKIKEAAYLLKETLPKSTTVGVYEMRNHGRIGIWNSHIRGGYNLFEQLKLKSSPAIEKNVFVDNKGVFIEEKDLLSYAADEMFVVVHCKEQEHRFTNQIWQNIPAMKRRKVHLLRLQDFWSSEGIALEYQLEIQMDYLLGRKQSDICL